MSNQKYILILTSKTGGGHVSLAEALRDLLVIGMQADNSKHQQAIKGTKAAAITIVDPQPGFLHLHYRVVSRYALCLWEAEFRFLDTPERALQAHQANAIFATTRETYKQALASGHAPERLHLVGWPVRAQFLHSDLSNREMRREKLTQLNLAPNRFTVFLQGGGEGAADIQQTIENVLAMSALTNDLQVILALGTNRNLLKRYKHVPNVATLPYTKEIASYMAAADIIMGKAGPNILFESVMLGKPFVATTFIPGQEQENLSFIQRHSLGWIATRPEEQRTLLTTLIHNAGQLDALSAPINTYREWNFRANKQIVPLIRFLIDP